MTDAAPAHANAVRIDYRQPFRVIQQAVAGYTPDAIAALLASTLAVPASHLALKVAEDGGAFVLVQAPDAQGGDGKPRQAAFIRGMAPDLITPHLGAAA